MRDQYHKCETLCDIYVAVILRLLFWVIFWRNCMQRWGCLEFLIQRHKNIFIKFAGFYVERNGSVNHCIYCLFTSGFSQLILYLIFWGVYGKDKFQSVKSVIKTHKSFAWISSAIYHISLILIYPSIPVILNLQHHIQPRT